MRYCAETPEHAVAEKLVRLRNQRMDDADLFEFGRRLALVEVRLEGQWGERFLDLCSAESLHSQGIGPDRTAFRDRATTQAISQRIYEAGYAGLRWWSVFFGEWHTLALFAEIVPHGGFHFSAPDPLELDHPAVREAADQLGISV